MTTTAWNNDSNSDSIITACCGQTCSSMDATGGNSANYNSYLTGVTTVGTNGGPSHYGTYDQSGNAAEWVEQGLLAGGHWNTKEGFLGRLYPSLYQRTGLLGNRGRGFRLTYSYPVIPPNFPVPATSISIDNFVSVGDPGNIMDTTSLGSVPLLFYIKKYEVTNLEYVNFLNAVASDSDRHDLFNPRIMPCGKRPGIIRVGQAGSYIYSCGPYMENKPVVGISWFNAARMANWLSNGSPPSSDINVLNSTEQGAYTMESVDKLPVTRNIINPNNKYPPIYRLPTLNEWYKAAYFDPDKNSGSAGYWQYATQNDQAPDPVLANDRYDGISQYVGAQGTDCSQEAALTPTFGAITSTADGFTAQITNYDALYLWSGSATANGQVSINTTTGLLTVTGVAANTSSTARITTRRTGYFDGSATVTATSLVGAALVPTFGTTTATSTGFTVQITNYNASYTWAGTATASGTVVVNSTGLVTVTNVAPVTSSTATITTIRSNYTSGSATVTVTSAVGDALVPTFGTQTRTASGFTVVITNYDSAYTWAGTATASGTVVVTGSGSTGLATITGVAANTSSTATITTTRTKYAVGSATVADTSLAAALVPTFGSTTPTANGFTVQIGNYDAAYTWAGTATASGSVVVSGTGLVTVSGVAANTSSTATITTTRTGYTGGSATVTATSLGAALVPTFGSTTATATGFTVQISNYNAAYTWTGTATASGSVSINGTGLVTVTGVAPGTSSTATITTTRTNYASGSATVTATSVVGTALTPTFGSTTSTTDGFTVQISNYSSNYDWVGTATASGIVVVSGTGLVTVTNVAANTSVTATITTTRTGYTGGTASVTVTTTSVVGTALTPTFGATTSTANGFRVQITNFNVNYTWAGTATASGTVVVSGTGLVTVSGVAPGTSSTATITTTRTGYTGGTANVTATSLLGGPLVPEFGTPTSTTDGFTVQILNYDSNYSWAGTATASGSVAINSVSGLVTVSGVAPGTLLQATITTTRTGYTGGTRTVLGRSTDGPAWVPEFGTLTRTANGFRVQIINYNSSYTWSITSFTGIGINYATFSTSTAVLTVIGMNPGATAAVTIQAARTGYTSGSNTVRATSLAAALTPTFGTPTSTADGFTVVITNYNSDYTWAGTATVSGSVAINSSTGLVTVTNVAPGVSSILTITTTQTGSVGGSGTISWTALSPAPPVTMDMVTVGNPGNAHNTQEDGRVVGSVANTYKIGKYEVTGSQYASFLNAVGKYDNFGLYNPSMATDTRVAQISRSGNFGSYTYVVMNNTGNRPITYVSWTDCARFCNWMSNGQPTGSQNFATTENGAYNINEAIELALAMPVNATNPNTGFAPTYRMPTRNEWYKAAYYSPNRSGTGVPGYWKYATQSVSAPGTTIGAGTNEANYNDIFDGETTNVGSFSGSGSFYGTFDQTGNVYEWNDLDGSLNYYRGLRGGYYGSTAAESSSGYYGNVSDTRPFAESSILGFRIASPV